VEGSGGEAAPKGRVDRPIGSLIARQERLPAQRGDAAEAVALGIQVAGARRVAAVAVGGQPLLGGEWVEALADDLQAPVGVGVAASPAETL
jgi:hypothetical protein